MSYARRAYGYDHPYQDPVNYEQNYRYDDHEHQYYGQQHYERAYEPEPRGAYRDQSWSGYSHQLNYRASRVTSCDYCGSTDHDMAACSAAKVEFRERMEALRQYRASKAITCGYCGAASHKIEACPVRIKDVYHYSGERPMREYYQVYDMGPYPQQEHDTSSNTMWEDGYKELNAKIDANQSKVDEKVNELQKLMSQIITVVTELKNEKSMLPSHPLPPTELENDEEELPIHIAMDAETHAIIEVLECEGEVRIEPEERNSEKTNSDFSLPLACHLSCYVPHINILSTDHSIIVSQVSKKAQKPKVKRHRKRRARSSRGRKNGRKAMVKKDLKSKPPDERRLHEKSVWVCTAERKRSKSTRKFDLTQPWDPNW